MGRTLIFDGTYLLRRAFHAKGDGWNLSSGEVKTGGAYLFLKSVHQALENISDVNRAVAVFDGRRSARRMELYPEYKQNRDKRPPIFDASGKEIDVAAELQAQRDILYRCLPLLGVRIAYLPEREGDDVIWAASRITGRSVIVTDDKDMLAMLCPTINVYRPSKEEYYTWQNFREEFGFDADLFTYHKAITGDKSDNIDGVKGSGPKAADVFCKMLQENGRDVEKTLAQCAADKSARIRYISEQRDVLSRNLGLVDCSYETLTAEEITQLKEMILYPIPSRDREMFLALCDRYKFSSLAGDVWFLPFNRLI